MIKYINLLFSNNFFTNYSLNSYKFLKKSQILNSVFYSIIIFNFSLKNNLVAYSLNLKDLKLYYYTLILLVFYTIITIILFYFLLKNLFYFLNIKFNFFLNFILILFFTITVAYIYIFDFYALIQLFSFNIYYYFFNYSFDYFTFFLFFYNFLVTYMLFFVLLTKYKNSNNFFLYFLLFFILIMLFLMLVTDSIFTFFLSYEFIMLPSVIVSYFCSPNKRSKLVSFYFLFWTQLGSFFFFFAILFLYASGVSKFNNYSFVFFDKYTIFLLKFFLFLGLGVKIPIWPLHFWLTKTHVEVNTAFSIFLSGVLVKISLIAFYRFFFIFLGNNYFFFFLVFLGILDITIKLFNQIDYKKIIAYCTIFEMNIILINLFFFDYNTIIYYVLFCILHTTLSSIFFFISDLLYKRFGTRCVSNINSIINHTPLFAIILLLNVLLFTGLPMTFKFNLEFVILQKMMLFDFFFFFIFLVLQYVFILLFLKFNLTILFNNININKKICDLSLYEFFIFLPQMLILFIF